MIFIFFQSKLVASEGERRENVEEEKKKERRLVWCGVDWFGSGRCSYD